MAEWAALPRDILVLIAKLVDFEDYFNLYAVCKSWYSVTSVLGKSHPLPSRFPWVMLTDKAEINYPKSTNNMDAHEMLINEEQKNEQIEGMHKRQFYSFSASKAYEFELPEATRKKCLAVGYGLLLTLGFDLQINILNPFTRQQIGMPNMLSFKSSYEYDERYPPQLDVSFFVRTVAISSNPYSSSNEDCIIMAIYGEYSVLGFARPGDKVWTDLCLPLPVEGTYPIYQDVVYYKGNFHAVDMRGNVVVCNINDANEPKATIIACGGPDDPLECIFRYLVESSGDLLLVVRFRNHKKPLSIDRPPYKYTETFSIFKMEECDGDSNHNYGYKFTEVKNLGNRALFIGNNASVSVPCSKCVKANSIYFCDEEVMAYSSQPCGGGYDTGIYDLESGQITLHYANKFMSHLTPPTWIIS